MIIEEAYGEDGDKLLYRNGSDDLVYRTTPEENMEPQRTVDYNEIETLTRKLLIALGEDPNRPGLRDTPRRVAAAWREFIEYDPGIVDTAFEQVTADQMVIVSGMKVWSMCEHHLHPFWAEYSVGYIARDKVLGLSKFARIVHHRAHGLQLQEQLTRQIADDIERVTRSPDVMVVGHGEHLCMTMRGIKTPSIMSSSAVKGVFRDRPEVRAEFMALVEQALRYKR